MTNSGLSVCVFKTRNKNVRGFFTNCMIAFFFCAGLFSCLCVVTTTGALLLLYLVLAAFFAALLEIATTIRDNGSTVSFSPSYVALFVLIYMERGNRSLT